MAKKKDKNCERNGQKNLKKCRKIQQNKGINDKKMGKNIFLKNRIFCSFRFRIFTVT